MLSKGLKFLITRLMPASVRKSRLLAFYEREISGNGEAELKLLEKFVGPGSICLDIGCNLGVYSYRMSQLGAKVTAFEPNPMLADMVRGLNLPNVAIEQVALSSSPGEAELLVPQGGAGHAIGTLRDADFGGRKVKKVKVPVRTIDAYNFAKIDFVKIDVEGLEEQVVLGALETIARTQPMLLIEIEERHNAGGIARIAGKLAELGYSARFWRDNDWTDLTQFDAARDQASTEDALSRPGYQTSSDHAYINNFFFVPATNLATHMATETA